MMSALNHKMNVCMYECVNVPIHIMHIFTQISLKQSKLLLGYGYLAEFVANDGKLIWGKPVDFIGNLCMSNYGEVQPTLQYCDFIRLVHAWICKCHANNHIDSIFHYGFRWFMLQNC